MNFLYRINGGQIIGISVNYTWPGHDTEFFGVLTDPPAPDGAFMDPLKINDNGTVRNATAGEISNFDVAKATDDNLIRRKRAKAILTGDSDGSVTFRATVLALLDQINLLRSQHGLSQITKAQALNGILNKVDSSEADGP